MYIYCKLCNKFYVGRSVKRLNERIGQHRRKFYEIVNDLNTHLSDASLFDNDDYSLGLHLVRDHDLVNKKAFNDNYQVFILEICSPKMLEEVEHILINRLKSLRPFGLNTQNPFSIPLLNYI